MHSGARFRPTRPITAIMMLLEPINSTSSRTTVSKNLGGPGQDLGGLCPPGPNVEPPLAGSSAFSNAITIIDL